MLNKGTLNGLIKSRWPADRFFYTAYTALFGREGYDVAWAIQPGAYDGGKKDDYVGWTEGFVLNDRVAAAYGSFQLPWQERFAGGSNCFPQVYPKPEAPIASSSGKYCGSDSGFVKYVSIISINATVSIYCPNLAGEYHLLKNQIEVSVPNQKQYTLGDNGAMLVNSGGITVGMLVGAMQDRYGYTLTYANWAIRVLEALSQQYPIHTSEKPCDSIDDLSLF